MEHLLNTFHALESQLYEDMANFASSFTSKYGISPSNAIAVILGSVCLYMFVKHHWGSEKKKTLRKSNSLAELRGGELAWRRLNDYKVALAIPDTLYRSELVLKGLLEEEHLDLNKLQSTAAKVEMSGKEDEAVKILKGARKRHAGKSHHVYEIEMLLVEMLIYSYKGNSRCLEEALACECLEHEIELDARRPLFKAVIYGLLENWDDAQRNWNEFIDIRESIKTREGLLQAENLDKITDFEKLKEIVADLSAK